MMRTNGSRCRGAWVPAAGWVFAGALMLSLVQPSAAAAQSECADMISGGPGNPAHGTLRGSQSVTLNFGVGAGVSVGFSVTFNVGSYSMTGGGTIRVRCDDYTEFGFQ